MGQTCRLTEPQFFALESWQIEPWILPPGINVVYGKNEAGKTTLHAFLTAMLFGLEKGRGRAKGTEGYLRYEPWHAPSYYSGALQFSVGGRPFYLERNFYHKEPRAPPAATWRSGEELSVAYGDLGMLLGGVAREAYENTCDIPQCKAVTGAELTGLLAEYLSDMSDGGDAGIRVTRAVEKLEQKKRSLQSQIKSEQEKREQQLRAAYCEAAQCSRRTAAGFVSGSRRRQRICGRMPGCSPQRGETDSDREDARTAENAGTASDRERRADGNGFPVRSLFRGRGGSGGTGGKCVVVSPRGLCAGAVCGGGRRSCHSARHRSRGQAYCAIGARGRRDAGENGKETTEAPRERGSGGRGAHPACGVGKAERTPACRVGGSARGEGNETMQSGGTAGSMQRSGRTGERTPAGT